MEEIWKVFEETPKSRYCKGHIYEISNLGRCRKDGVIQPITRWCGAYPTFRHYLVHRLVAEAFIPNPNNYNIVEHIDTDCTNNVVTNLRWTTQKNNLLNPISREKYFNTVHSKEYHDRRSKYWLDYYQTEKGLAHREKQRQAQYRRWNSSKLNIS